LRSYVPQLIKFGVFAVVTILLTGLLVSTVAKVDLTGKTRYTALFTDATGLNTGDDVRMAGVKIGRVTDIRVADNRYAAVTFEVEQQRHLSDSVGAAVKYRNLIGQRYVSLDVGAGDARRSLPPGATIPVSRTKPPLNLTVLFNGFKPLFQALSPQQVNQLSYEIIQVFQGEGGTINGLLQHTASVTSTVARKDQVIGKVVDNLNGVLSTVNQRGPELSGLIDQMQQLVSGLAQQRRPIGDAITSIGGLTSTTAGLLQDGRQPLKDDIANLGRLSDNLNRQQPLMQQQLQQMPDRVSSFSRTASYAGWFNYFACQMHGTIGIKSLGVQAQLFPLPAEQLPDRCKP
jgi:phospholipid/cholesterol/gamma-HCH transport system substrate-binding protein